MASPTTNPRPLPASSGRLPPGAVALVTGAGSGIGRATALALAARGAVVIATDVDGDAADATRAEAGPDASSHRLDVGDQQAVAALAELVRDEHGALDVLVNNAGVGHSGRFLDTPLEDWDWILDVNVRGIVHGCHAFGPAMIERGRGQVVNICSALGYFPRATEPLYGTTKAAALAFSRSLRADWQEHGVGVTAVCPGVINTPIARNTRLRGERSRAAVLELFDEGRAPESVADAIVTAIDRDKPFVPVGPDAWAAWIAHRLVPARLADRLARVTADGV